MLRAQLLKDKRGLKGIEPTGGEVVATFFQWSELPVVECHRDYVVLEADDGSRFKASWDGIKLLREE